MSKAFVVSYLSRVDGAQHNINFDSVTGMYFALLRVNGQMVKVEGGTLEDCSDLIDATLLQEGNNHE